MWHLWSLDLWTCSLSLVPYLPHWFFILFFFLQDNPQLFKLWAPSHPESCELFSIYPPSLLSSFSRNHFPCHAYTADHNFYFHSRPLSWISSACLCSTNLLTLILLVFPDKTGSSSIFLIQWVRLHSIIVHDKHVGVFLDFSFSLPPPCLICQHILLALPLIAFIIWSPITTWELFSIYPPLDITFHAVYTANPNFYFCSHHCCGALL